ncbi:MULTISPECIES: hypothetical protein [Cyanophyceae]|uniref:hypothetical protein n=1 Tax=Cyanophyceae TaxID=3028117 RepID=UPI001687BF71|nr:MULTISPECIES: hypothetical protein [Cyanophyceae]MBD1917617.1 hypothetical protein [Phormidium sp. FACHB-77]MBD2029507.1 hypothetical protein [Phormidium sp. FACHB-322]MBD2050768.1 hypothetical protein [Leptolyngbya sp. FACHB-60]
MFSELSQAPRYCLDDESPWLKGIDPLRRYWIGVNGDPRSLRVMSGFATQSEEAFKQAIRNFRSLAIGQELILPTGLSDRLTIHCVAENCYAIADCLTEAEVWHLFDTESLESLLLTAHPDWQCAPQHLNLGRSLLTAAWGQPSVPRAA